MMQAIMSVSCCSSPAGAVAAVCSSTRVSQKHGAAVQRMSTIPLRFNRQFSSLVRAQPTDQETVNYEGNTTTVFPAEACDELGEEFCGLEGVGQEVKPKAQAPKEENTSKEAGIEREYEDYKGEKTVFRDEACDDLGGEFCDPEFQKDEKK